MTTLGHVEDDFEHGTRVAPPSGNLGDMGAIGAPELIIVLLIVLLIFGGTKLPKLARSLGEAQREFRKGQDELTSPAPKDDTSTS